MAVPLLLAGAVYFILTTPQSDSQVHELSAPAPYTHPLSQLWTL
jgi:hypothetical protein